MNTKERYPRIIDGGERSEKPGRKFEYTEQDFIDSYFGKDGARNASLDYTKNSIFGLNESYKEKYPINKYMKMPDIEAQRKKIQDRTDIHPIDSESKDGSFINYMDTLDMEGMENNIKDTPHPTDKNRSLIKDSQFRIENYLKRKEARTGFPIWNTKEIAGIRKQLREEYFPKPVKKEVVEEGDTKLEEKFEPFYEGEGKSENAEATNDVTVE